MSDSRSNKRREFLQLLLTTGAGAWAEGQYRALSSLILGQQASAHMPAFAFWQQRSASTPPTPSTLMSVGSTGTPYINTYSTADWTMVPDPATPPPKDVRDVVFSPDGSIMVAAHLDSPYFSVYRTSDWVKLADPPSLPPGSCYSAAFSPDSSLFVVGHGTPGITIYKTNGSTNPADWTTLPTPGTSLAGTCYGLAFKPDSSELAVSTSSSPYVTIFNTSDWTATRPATQPTGSGETVAYNDDGTLFAIAHWSSPYISVYRTSDWTKLGNPSTLATGNAKGVAFSPDGSLVVLTNLTSPYITVYKTNGSSNPPDWTALPTPNSPPAGAAKGRAAFNSDGSLFAVAHGNSPYVTIYNSADWTKLNDPGALPRVHNSLKQGFCVNFNPAS